MLIFIARGEARMKLSQRAVHQVQINPPEGRFIWTWWLIYSRHFCKKLFVMVNNVLATDHWSKVHFNAILSSPRGKMLKNLCITFGFKQTRHTPCTWSMDAKEHFKAGEVICLRHFTWIPQLAKTLVGSELSVNIWKDAVRKIHLHDWLRGRSILC